MAVFELNVTLGDTYRDKITGFIGTATDVSFNVMKCCRVYLMPKVDDKGELQEGAWFDSPCLEHRISDNKYDGFLEAGRQITVDDLLEERPAPSGVRPGGPISRVK